MKFLHITFLFIIFFFLAMGTVTVLDVWPEQTQIFFAFVTASLLTWLSEALLKKSSRSDNKVSSTATKEEPLVEKTIHPDNIAQPAEPKLKKSAANDSSLKQPELSKSKKSSRHQGWLPSGENAVIQGRDIGGMVYLGTPPNVHKNGYYVKCRSYINSALKVAKVGDDPKGHDMPYWPGYSSITPRCRATYLDWLAGGKSDPSYNPGYMFLYFYGLERRFFVDEPSDDEKRQIYQEVERLARLFPDNQSVQRYLGEFIEVAKVATTPFDQIEPMFEHSGWELPLSLKIAIGRRLSIGERIDAEWTLSWFLCHPERSLRTPATRCREEFMALFKLRFEERFPENLKVTKPRKMLKASYPAASSEFVGSIDPSVNNKPIPDISGLRKTIEIAQEIADEVIEELDKFSRFLGRNPDGRGSVEGHALLPPELWPLFPSEDLENLKRWADEIVAAGGLVPVSDVIEHLEGERPVKIGKKQLTGVADALARVGFGLAPDPRFAMRSPKLDEPVVLFDLGERVEKLEDVSDKYQSALMDLALGAFIAHSDGQVGEPESRSLEQRVAAAKGLNGQEMRRLRANLDWFLAVPPDMSLLRRKLKDTNDDNQTAIRSALVTAAHADGIIRPEEVTGIEKIYKTLGLDPALAYSDLHAGDIADSPRTVRAAQPSTAGEMIPEEKTNAGPTLDASRIATIRSDTARVSSVLGKIFDSDEDDQEQGVDNSNKVLSGLDQNHTALVRDLVERQHWTEDAFEALCAQHSLLASGALEAVNEWAFDTHDEALLEEYEGYDIIPEIAAAIKQELNKGSIHDQTETA